jgi:hypothetical protein
VSAGNFVETALIIDASRDPVASRRFDDLIKEAQIIVEAVTEAQARIAREAYRDFGKLVAIQQGLISAIALPTPWRRSPGKLCCSKATILLAPILNLRVTERIVMAELKREAPTASRTMSELVEAASCSARKESK